MAQVFPFKCPWFFVLVFSRATRLVTEKFGQKLLRYQAEITLLEGVVMAATLTIQHGDRFHWMSDLTNMKFGHLIALRPTSRRKCGAVVWECRCDCKDRLFVYLSAGQLKNSEGYNLHCGCRDTEADKLEAGTITDITGQTFGHLTAIRPTSRRSGGSVVWQCKCRCGETVYRAVSFLKAGGDNQSCGCMMPEVAKEAARKSAHYIDGTRVASIRSQPMLSNNRSGIRGVHWDANAKKWRAVIYFKGSQIHLGLFKNIEDAKDAREKAEDKLFRPVIEAFDGNVKNICIDIHPQRVSK